jgi:hypothetical protein
MLDFIALFRENTLVQKDGSSTTSVSINICRRKELDGLDVEFLGRHEGSSLEYYMDKSAIGKVDLSDKIFIK